MSQLKLNKQNNNESMITEGGNSCSLKGAVFFTLGIKRALPLLHAGPGCSWCAYYGMILHSGESYPFTNTGMCSNEVIFGGENKLRKGIIDANKIHNPDLIIVTTGCQALTIGDDVDAVVNEVNENANMDTRIVSSGTGGYDGNLYDGFVKTGVACLKQLCREQPIRKRTVNIIGFPAHIDIFWKGDIEEIRNLLSSIGVEVNCFFPGDVSVKQIEEIPSAELNLVVDEQLGTEMAEYLKHKFGTPYIKPAYGSLIGSDNTREFFQAIIKELDLPEETGIIIERKMIRALRMASNSHHLWSEGIQYATSTYAITAHASMALGLIRMLTSEFGMEPKVVNFNPSFPGSKEKLLKLLEEDGRDFKPIIAENKDTYEMSRFLDDGYPGLVLGKGTKLKTDAFLDNAKAFMSVSYPCLDRIIIYERPIMGFNGVPAFLDDFLSRMQINF